MTDNRIGRDMGGLLYQALSSLLDPKGRISLQYGLGE